MSQVSMCGSIVEAGYRSTPRNEILVITERNRGLATSILDGCHTVYTGILVLTERFDGFATSVITSFDCITKRILLGLYNPPNPQICLTPSHLFWHINYDIFAFPTVVISQCWSIPFYLTISACSHLCLKVLTLQQCW